MMPVKAVAIYIAVVSAVAVIFTAYDKIAAKRLPRSRVPEATLLLLSAIGGSVAMYLTMLLIRHKTQHKKFMLGIPAIMIVQSAALILTHLYVFPVIALPTLTQKFNIKSAPVCVENNAYRGAI